MCCGSSTSQACYMELFEIAAPVLASAELIMQILSFKDQPIFMGCAYSVNGLWFWSF